MAELDIVIPVYNEGKNIAATLRSLAAHVRTPARALICYDMPDDDTLPAVEAHRGEFAHLAVEPVRNRGRGPHAAVLSGFAASTAPWVLVYPADDDYNAPLVERMVEAAKAGADVVCASRFMPGGSMHGAPPLKNFLVRVGNWALYRLARVPTHDASNGLRLFSRRVIQQIPVRSSFGFTYSIELLVKAHRRGWRITELPAQWLERRTGRSRFNVLGWLPAYLRWCLYAFKTTCWHRHKALSALVIATLLLTALPAVDVALVVGHQWRGVVPSFTDEVFYQGHVEDIAAKGRLNDGNPYFMEDAGKAPLVLFGGSWLNAVPQLLGMPLIPALYLNFIIFSLAFTVLFYWLMRELWVPRRWAAAGSLLLYLQCIAHVWRPANLQPVYPDIILFYIGLVRLIKKPSRGNIWLLGLATGASFYLYAYFWQVAVITLGLLFFYTLARRQWPLMRAVLWASLVGGLIGLPDLLYTLWLSHAYPYFLASMARFGLVYTHLPMAEVIYSGGWVGLVLALLALLWWRAPFGRSRTGEAALRGESQFRIIALSLALSGLGLWVMQGSNALTGILLETGEHLRILILPWLLFATVVLAAYLARSRAALAPWLRAVALCAVAVFSVASGYYTYVYAQPFVAPTAQRQALWLQEEGYAGVFAYLQAHAQRPAVVWSDPRLSITTYLPVFTRHYDLYTPMGMWELVPTSEVEERFLVSQYFTPPSTTSLAADLPLYKGRQIAFHDAATIARGVKICRILFFWDKARNCGTELTSAQLLGSAFFTGLERQFTQDIRPNILAYLAKYHVTYILKDKVADAAWHPTQLGAVPVYQDARYELYKLPH